MNQNNLEIINLVDSSLTSLAKKGNLGYAEEMYNPLNFFKSVHHISFDPNDKNVNLKNPTIKVHTIKIIWRRIPVIRWIVNGLLAFVWVFRIAQIARKNKVCLIRGRDSYQASLLGLIVSKLLRIPFVVSIGGNNRLANELAGQYPLLNSKFLSDREEEIVLKGADKVICPNEYSRDYVIDIGVSPEKTCVIPLRLKDNIFNFACHESVILSNNGVDVNKPIILSALRFEGDKQVDVLIEAIPLVTKYHPEVQFVLIGDGSLRSKMEQRVAELGQGQNVYFLSYQPTEIIKYCLSVATAVCIPMSGFVIYEAAAASKAIIAFDIEWHSEFIKDGETGLLVENRNCDKLAEAIKRLVKDPQLASQLGKNVRSLLEADFNPRRIAEREIAELLDVIRKNAPHSQK
jgi:glycosyltransferase involved in cell wall biosynthesis